jgi:hypothetical protein
VGGQTLHREKEIERKKTRIPKKKNQKLELSSLKGSKRKSS